MYPRSLSTLVVSSGLVLLAGCNIGSRAPLTAVDALAAPKPLVTSRPPIHDAQATSTKATRPARPATSTYDMKVVESLLTAQNYYIGEVNGTPSAAFRSAIMAFQKVNGLPADGVVGPVTRAALNAPRQFVPRGSSSTDRVEVDLTRQVLSIVRNGKVTRVLAVSSGDGARYTQKNGYQARSLTPTGYYRIERRILGAHRADLGTLYNPQYFYKGWAIHGSNVVPATPASHGCIRVSRADAIWLIGQLNVGMAVYVYGGKHTFAAGSNSPGTDNPSGDG